MLMTRVAVGLQRCDQCTDSRRQDDQVTRSWSGCECMRNTRRYKHGGPWTGGFRAVGVQEREFSLQHVPRFVVGVVHVKRSRSAATPFVDTKRVASRGESFRSHSVILT